MRRAAIGVCLAASWVVSGALLCCVNLDALEGGMGNDAMADGNRHDARTDGARDAAVDRGGRVEAGVEGGAARKPVTLATGGVHTCVIVDGGVYCFGYNGTEQVSPETVCDAARCVKPVHVALDASAAAVEVVGGQAHTCALLADGTAFCWGDDTEGELGLGPVLPRIVSGPVSTTVRFARIVAGSYDSCAIRNNDDLYCWGANDAGQLGTRDTTNRGAPAAVPGLAEVVDVGLGLSFTCAVISDGGVQCWGVNTTNDMFCDAGALCSLTPVPVAGLEGVKGGAKRVAVGSYHACALMADSTVLCWGYNGHGQVGDGTLAPRLSAVEVQYTTSNGPLKDVVELGAGAEGTCAVLRNGNLVCWGDEAFTAQYAYAALVPGVAGVAQVAISQGGSFACIRFAEGGVSCAGDNASGQLGRSDCTASTGCPLEPVVGLP